MIQKALITGAAGGLGIAVVKTLLDLDYHIIALDIDTSGLTGLGPKKNLSVHRIDITDQDALQQLLKNLGLEREGLDVLINLAGIYDTFPVTEQDMKDFRKIMDVNFLACAGLVSACLPLLVRRRGRVVIVSSESYKIQALFQPYMISKAALEAYCRVARQELLLMGVRLSVIRPGAFKTGLLGWMDEKKNRQGSIYQDEFRNSIHWSKKLVGRITTPEKVAVAVVHAATSSRPRRIYRVNNNPLLSLISLLPANLLDRAVISRFK